MDSDDHEKIGRIIIWTSQLSFSSACAKTCFRNLTERIPPQEEISSLVGKAGQKLRGEDLTESLKAADPLAWVQHMNSIQARVREMVSSELVNR